ncbi:glycosyltransferase [Candidatus Micrarchaeota archaeon]|nr:glycosyltransferase [Candidatus Micrarchaeota archaeon]
MIRTDICVLIPTLNEEDAIFDVVKTLPKRVRNLKVTPVVIDGRSKDRTVSRAKQAGATVLIQKTRGKGAAIQEALEQISCDYVVFIDGDGTYQSVELPKLVEPLMDGKTDMTVATRLAQRDSASITPFNTLGNIAFNALIRFFYGKNITDMLTGYRALSRKKLDELNLVSQAFEVETEITIEALRNNLRIHEFPLFYKKRKGQTKLNPIHDGLRIFKTLILMIRDTKPLYFFGILGFLFFLFGLWPASLVVYEKIVFGSVQHVPSTILAAFSFLLAIQIWAIGMLADMSLKNNQRLENLLRKKR